jgi:DNA polymerase-3 subunit delta
VKIKPEALELQLKTKLERLYFIFGAEILLIEQNLAQIKLLAKQAGFNEKVSFEITGNFDWRLVQNEFNVIDLFSPKRIIELHLKTAKLGIKGSKALVQIVKQIPEDILLIIRAEKLDFAQQKSKWFGSLVQTGTVVQHWEVQPQQLDGWIMAQLHKLGLSVSADIVQQIAFCTQGNLLASQQEIQKLQMAYPDGKVDETAYLAQLTQQSQYSIYTLIDIALAGDAQKMHTIFKVLLEDSAMPIKLNTALFYEIKNLITMALELRQSKNINSVLQAHRVWPKRQPIISKALMRLSYQNLQKMLLTIGYIDRSIKGLDELEPTQELLTLLLSLSGKTLWKI